MYIYVTNVSTVLTNAEVAAAMPAFAKFKSHVQSFWPRPCTLLFVPPDQVPADRWKIVIADDSDQAGALGYHDYSPGGKPISYVFAKTDKQYGYSWTVTFTHELAEMIADPYINELIQVTDKYLYAKENCDAVEADELGYTITTDTGVNVLVSDFVTPAWFVPGHPGPVYDKMKHCTAPLQVLAGGYMSIFVSGKGWTQVNAEGAEVGMDAKADHRGHYSRPLQYARTRPNHSELGLPHLA